MISIVGNTLAIHTLLRKRMRRKRSAILFLNLSMADCLVTIFPMAGNIVQAACMASITHTLSGQLVWELLCRRWYAGVFACKIFKVSIYSCVVLWLILVIFFHLIFAVSADFLLDLLQLHASSHSPGQAQSNQPAPQRSILHTETIGSSMDPIIGSFTPMFYSF